jgi:hypothetical protein
VQRNVPFFLVTGETLFLNSGIRRVHKSRVPRSAALYFPYINVPNNAWMLRTLLYWEKLHSIVPVEYSFYEDPNGRFMHDLVQHGLIEPLFPREHLYQIPNFGSTFLEYIRPIHQAADQGAQNEAMNRKTARIHVEKLDALGDELIDMGLAKRGEDFWYYTPPWLAAHFMTFYSIALGQLKSVDASPLTDNDECFRIACGSRPAGRLIAAEDARVTLVDEMLPAPVYADMKAIVEFKKSHGAQLHEFRRRIEKAVADVVAQPDDEAQREMVNALKTDLHDEKEDISQQINERFRNVVLWPLVTVAATTLGFIGSENSHPLAASVGAGFGIVAAVRQSLAAQRGYAGALTDPLAYALFYEKWVANLPGDATPSS